MHRGWDLRTQRRVNGQAQRLHIMVPLCVTSRMGSSMELESWLVIARPGWTGWVGQSVRGDWRPAGQEFYGAKWWKCSESGQWAWPHNFEYIRNWWMVCFKEWMLSCVVFTSICHFHWFWPIVLPPNVIQEERRRLKNAIIIQSFIRGYRDRKQQVSLLLNWEGI